MRTAKLPGGMEVAYKSTTALDILKREFFADRQYEDAGIELNDGDVVFDVGANIGFFTLYLSRTLQNARVFCFEPIPETYALLRHNLQSSNLEVRALNIGLADREGTATFHYFPRINVNSSMNVDDSPRARRDARQFVLEEIRKRNWAGRVLVEYVPAVVLWPVLEIVRRWGTKAEKVECTLRTLSSVVVVEQIERIDLLKIDVEGAEESVLAGIEDQHWPSIRQIMVETHFGPAQARRVADLLTRRGFATKWSPSIAGVDNLHLVVGMRKTAVPLQPQEADCVGT